MKLYQLTEQYTRLRELLSNPDLDDSFEIGDKLVAIEGALEEKLENIACLMREMELEAQGYDEEIRRLERRKNSIEKRRDWLFQYTGNCLGQGNKARTEHFTFSWRKTSAVSIVNEAAIPPHYMRTKTTIEPDKKLLAQHLEDDLEIPGVELVDRWHLQVK